METKVKEWNYISERFCRSFSKVDRNSHAYPTHLQGPCVRYEADFDNDPSGIYWSYILQLDNVSRELLDDPPFKVIVKKAKEVNRITSKIEQILEDHRNEKYFN